MKHTVYRIQNAGNFVALCVLLTTFVADITDPLRDVTNFIQSFESSYGAEHPNFYHNTYSQVRIAIDAEV